MPVLFKPLKNEAIKRAACIEYVMVYWMQQELDNAATVFYPGTKPVGHFYSVNLTPGVRDKNCALAKQELVSWSVSCC